MPITAQSGVLNHGQRVPPNGQADIIGPDERVELLDGELISMPPIDPEHSYSVRRLNTLFQRRFAGLASVSVQGPVTLDRWSEPQPDVMLNALPEERYAVAHPTPLEFPDEQIAVADVLSPQA